MSALRAIHPHPPRDGQNNTAPPVDDGRRSGGERRQADRRGNVYTLVDKENRLRFAARAAGFGVFDLDCARKRVFLSSELSTMAGLPPGNANFGLDEVERLVHPDDRGCVVDQLRASLDRGHGDEGFEADFRLLRPDGSVRWVKACGRTYSVGEGAEGPARTATGIVMDVTAAHDAELALRRSREEFELALHGAAMGMWNWDMRTGEVLWSERCRELFGMREGEAESYDRFLSALHPEDRERTVAAVGQATEQRREFNIEYRVVWPEGSVHWINAVGRCFFDEAGGTPLRMSGVVLDITARKEWEETLVGMNEQLESRIGERTAALVQAKEALERSNLELQQFAYIAAHDLKTPLRSIIGFAQLFHGEYRGHLDARADTWLEQLLRSAERMHELIQDLLAYSRVDSQGRSFAPIDMRELFDQVTSALDSLIRESGARVSCGELPVVMGDRSQLAQVLQNLIDNGIKYRGSAPPEVRVTARRDAEGWLFEVRDKGIGIAERHRERIFDIFHRLHTQQEYPGTGIGLAVCRRVLHRHGGRIWVESEPGKGSVFRFTLPDKSRVSA